MVLRLTFELTLKSDYHIGAGYGLGSIDSALHRDPDGVPVLRGTTLVGLFRDALRELLQFAPLHAARRCKASGLADAGAEYCGQWATSAVAACPLCAVFGSPAQPKRWRISTARPAGYANQATTSWEAGTDGAHTAPHVRVNPRTRRAEAGKLFFREEGDERLVFRFTATCDAQDAATLSEAAWLLAAARAVRHLGASRRRGRGECDVHLVAVNNGAAWGQPNDPAQGWEAWLLEQFETLHLKGQALELQAQDMSFVPSQNQSPGPVRVLMIAHLDEPLILSQKAEAGNEFETMDTIAGAAVRGAFAARVAARHDLQNTGARSYGAFVELFIRDQVRFSMLYPAHRPKEADSEWLYPCIPAPGGLLSCEIHPGYRSANAPLAHGVNDYTHRAAPADYEPECPEPGCGSALKPLSGFYSLQTNPQQVTVQHLQEMHVQLAPETGRAAKGKLYSFDALQPGQTFVGELWCANAAAWENLQGLANLPKDGPVVIRLGKANRRGYGQVTLWLQPHQKEHPWYGLPLDKRVALNSELTLMLLSDTIAADAWGRFRSSFDKDWLEALLKVKVDVKRSFCSTRLVDAFNNHLGLPRWRDMALCSGSAVGFRIAESLTAEQQKSVIEIMRSLEKDGIGLRRNEGFGRVVFNHPLYGLWQQLDNDDTGILRPASSSVPTVASGADDVLEDAEFLRQWEWDLGKRNFTAVEAPEFAAVARLLEAQPPDSPEALDALLAQLGHYESLIPVAQQAELRVRDAGRANTEFFRSKASTGLNLVREIGDALETKVADFTQPTKQRRWRSGMQMLAADMVAAQKARERKRVGKASEEEAR